jgi:hypothetical protein
MMDLPVAKIVIHKHGGWVDIAKTSEQAIKLTIILPL